MPSYLQLAVCKYVSVYLRMYMRISACLCKGLSVQMRISAFMYVNTHHSAFDYINVCQFIHVCKCVSVYL